ncbi:MAG: polymerase subunit beta [Amycolatopsis sp.]|uniref:nucleotidyltransferase domain-containing protein n=1 Tax=Amycolatopsis sp. TaxID=37632 RepID=UPI003457E786|nr:polymerase subunit beta [Amycolatopsis sp.]
MRSEDEIFGDQVAAGLAGPHHVQAVTLGGSRATRTHRPDSDWDFAVYYRGAFNPENLRELGWPGGHSDLLVVAEPAVNRILRGALPQPDYPDALRESGPARWWGDACVTLDYARGAHAERGHVTDVVGVIATAACQTAHAVAAVRGEWVTNEKTFAGPDGAAGNR